MTEEQVRRYKEVLTNYLSAKETIEGLIKRYRPEKLFSIGLADQCAEVIDRTLRFTTFKVASHYWEARWIEETESFLLDPLMSMKSLPRLCLDDIVAMRN